MVTRWILMGVLTGCSGTVLRDRDTYIAEVAFTDRVVQGGAGAVRDVLTHQCECGSGSWRSVSANVTDRLCRDYADWWTVYAVRWSWHRDMMLYNGRLRDARPSVVPPLPPRRCELPDARPE